jgi:hypothetical protein
MNDQEGEHPPRSTICYEHDVKDLGYEGYFDFHEQRKSPFCPPESRIAMEILGPPMLTCCSIFANPKSWQSFKQDDS